ncbi:MAG: DUF2520 domain-containing protein [Ignavibacteriaceae bacterium]
MRHDFLINELVAAVFKLRKLIGFPNLKVEVTKTKVAQKFWNENQSNNHRSGESCIFTGFCIKDFFTVPDGEIKKVAVELSHLKLNFKNSYFIHLSGSENIETLNPLKRKGGRTASIHPMQTFPSHKIVSLKNVYAAIEIKEDNRFRYLGKLCKTLGMIPFRIKSDKKSLYHLAGVFASNFLAGNLFVSKRMLVENKIPENMFFNILNATVNTTLSNIKKVGPAKALSGPVERGDIQTICKHISSLKKMIKKPDGKYFFLQLKNYIVQSINLLDLVEEKQGKLNNTHLQIRKLLVRELRNLKDSN